MNMSKLVIVKQGQAEALPVLGSEVRFICQGDHTNHAWSMMECSAPQDVGPPPHHHEWDEAYYVIAGEVRFSLADREVTLAAGDFIYIPGGTLHGFHGASSG